MDFPTDFPSHPDLSGVQLLGVLSGLPKSIMMDDLLSYADGAYAPYNHVHDDIVLPQEYDVIRDVISYTGSPATQQLSRLPAELLDFAVFRSGTPRYFVYISGLELDTTISLRDVFAGVAANTSISSLGVVDTSDAKLQGADTYTLLVVYLSEVIP